MSIDQSRLFLLNPLHASLAASTISIVFLSTVISQVFSLVPRLLLFSQQYTDPNSTQQRKGIKKQERLGLVPHVNETRLMMGRKRDLCATTCTCLDWQEARDYIVHTLYSAYMYIHVLHNQPPLPTSTLMNET